MNFDFQQMKPVIQREFDEILDQYPIDLTEITNQIPVGGDTYVRKLTIIENAAEKCPVYIFPHYPFAFELASGEKRDVCYVGVGNECLRKSGVDFSPLQDFQILLDEYHLGSFNTYTDFLHRTCDHDKLLAKGFRGVYEECEALNEKEADAEKRRYRELVMHCCKAVEKIGLRLQKRAAEMLKNTGDADAEYNLSRMIHAVNTPWEAPKTYYDALHCILLTCLVISVLDGEEMQCYGQLDRLLFPFYERDLREGKINREEAYFLLQCFLHKTDLHCHFNDERKIYDNGVSVMIGGCDPQGKPVYNEITKMMLQAYAENKLINPKLNARAGKSSPWEYVQGLAALIMTGNNNLVVENDDYIIPMFQQMGLSFEDASTYVGNGCQEVICRNQLHSRAFVYLNMPQVMLDTIRYEKENLPEKLQTIYRDGCFRKGSYAELQSSFLTNLRAYIQAIADAFRPFEKLHPQINPEPMLSAFTADCIRDGRDLSQGGSRYNHKTLSLVGFGTLCDSMLSLKRAYEAGTEKELFAAVLENFEGQENLRRELLASEDRFGHSETADAFARAFAHELAQVSQGITNACGIEWRTSLFTYYRFQYFGQITGATPDGRSAGEGFSRQMNMAKMPDLTTAALSMTALTEAEFHDVGMFDFALPCTVAESEKAVQALADFIRTCIALKLPVLQPNVADIKTMQEERDRKGTHPDLVVRVCGYSALFGQLPEEMQDEIISRAINAGK